MEGFQDDSVDFDFTAASSGENKNTKRKTETDMRIFSAYLISLNELRPIEALPPIELDRYLTTFFSVIKKHDGNEYEPASLRGMLCSVERYLRSRNYPSSVTRDAIFLNTRNMLKEKQKILREISKTQKKTKQESLTASTVERLKQLYNAKEFGPYSPTAIINSLCFAFVIHLKIRKAVDHKQMLWGDITLKRSGTNEYLCYEPLEGFDYIRPRLSGISQFRIYSQPTQDSSVDPIYIYKLYASKRPKNMMTPDSPFYLGIAVLCNTIPQQQQWFKPSPMGVNKLSDLVRMIRDITGSLSVMPVDSLSVFEDKNYKDIKDAIPFKHISRSESSPSYDTDELAHDYSITGCHNKPTAVVDIPKYESDEETMPRVLTRSDTEEDRNTPKEKDDCRLGNVKKTISECIESLDDTEKTEIFSWLSTLVDKNEKDDEDDQKFLVTFSLTSSQLKQQTPLSLYASVMRCKQEKIYDNASFSTDLGGISKGSESGTFRNTHKRQISDTDQDEMYISDADLERNKDSSSEIVTKRCKSANDDFTDDEQDQDTGETTDSNSRPDSTQNHNSEPCQQIVYPVEISKDYTPAYSWPAVDPRLAAMFMRQSLIASYRNLINVDNSSVPNKPNE